MTDFVDRLLGRSALPPIRPLIPTLFEPLRSDDADEPLPMGAFTDTPVGAVNHPRRAADGDTPPRPLVPHVQAAPDRVGPERTAVLERCESVRQVEIHHHHTRSAHPAPAPTSAVPLPPGAEVATEPPAPGAVQTAPPSYPEVFGPITSAAAHVPRRSEREPAVSSAAAVRPALSVSTRRQDRRQEPDVHISIGRVEITARPSENRQRSRGESPTGPRLSLEDYLRGRAGDGR